MSELSVSTRMAYAKSWCEEVRSLYDARQRKADELRRLELSMDGLKGIRYDMDGGKASMEHGDDAVFATMERIDRARDALVAKENEVLDGIAEFTAALDSMENQAYARLLSMRYCDRYEWEDIAKRLCYSCDHVRGYMHIAALCDLYDTAPARRRIPTAL